jgi:pimeloyl-ACP methyl ester carboxylesterase
MSARAIQRPATLLLDRPDGRIAYDLLGEGPLVICCPGMGDVRSVYRFLAPALAVAGFRVARMDLRGHGDSDASFGAYGDVAAGTDLIALAEHLGGPAILVGNSMGAAVACWAAAERPDLCAGLLLLGPFVRNGSANAFGMLLFRLMLLKPWGPWAWRVYFRTLYPTRRGAEFESHNAEVVESLRRPGHWGAFRASAETSHAPVEARLGEVQAPALVVMGDRDPDFSDPVAEARWIAERLGGEILMVKGAGHYPQAEFPEIVSPAVVAFARKVNGMTKSAHALAVLPELGGEQPTA